VVAILEAAIKKAAASDELVSKMAAMGLEARFASGAQVAKDWEAMEVEVKPLIEAARAKK
jgi:tripartite-type tricarboxylate transporter receptor subunit TctC